MPSLCPLTDCTIAVENAANITAQDEQPKLLSSFSKLSGKLSVAVNGNTNTNAHHKSTISFSNISNNNSTASQVFSQQKGFLKRADGCPLLFSVKPAAATAAAANTTVSTLSDTQGEVDQRKITAANESAVLLHHLNPSPRPVPPLSPAKLSGGEPTVSQAYTQASLPPPPPAPQVVRHNPYAACCLDLTDSTAEDEFEAYYSAPASPMSSGGARNPYQQGLLSSAAVAAPLTTMPIAVEELTTINTTHNNPLLHHQHQQHMATTSQTSLPSHQSLRCASPNAGAASAPFINSLPSSPILFADATSVSSLMASPRGHHQHQHHGQPAPFHQPAPQASSAAAALTSAKSARYLSPSPSCSSHRQSMVMASPVPPGQGNTGMASSPASPSAVRVTRKVVVSGGVDRSTGRPIPKCMSAQ